MNIYDQVWMKILTASHDYRVRLSQGRLQATISVVPIIVLWIWPRRLGKL